MGTHNMLFHILLFTIMSTAASNNNRIALNDGNSIPVVGLGVFQSGPGQETYTAVLTALQNGYRHIDSAALYKNEADVGRAVRDSGVPRSEVFITTKLWAMGGSRGGPNGAYEYALHAAEQSLSKLGTHIDLYLIHSPHGGPAVRREDWRALEDLKESGHVRSIGVSNYGVGHLQELFDSPDLRIPPAVNQVEIHPFLRRDDIAAFCESKGVLVEAYSPLAKARRMDDPTLVRIGAEVGRSPAQVLIRWGLQKGYKVLPKSVTPERIASNADVFGWELSPDHMAVLDGLDQQMTTGWNPTTVAWGVLVPGFNSGPDVAPAGQSLAVPVRAS